MFLEVKHISKQIGADEVLKDITISMEKGKIYGFQGKNGCGKSMLMRVGHSNAWQRYNRWRTAWKRTIVSTKPGNDD